MQFFFFYKCPHRLTGEVWVCYQDSGWWGGGGGLGQQEHLHQPGILQFYFPYQFRQQHHPHPYQQDSYCEHLFCRY